MGCLRGLVVLVVLFIGLAIVGSMIKNDGGGNIPVSASTTAPQAKVKATPPARPYGERLAESMGTLEDYDLTADVETVDDILASLTMLDVFATIAAEPAPEADKAQRAKFIAALGAKQKAALPVLRDKYGPAMRRQLWEADGKARTIGGGFRTVEFVSAAFAANRNIASIHQTMYPSLMKLRFTRAQYKWIDAAVEYTYYNLEPPGDGEVGTWSGTAFRAVN